MAMGSRRGKAGRFSVTRLRRWLLAGVILLLVVLAGLIGYTRWKLRKLRMDLPHRLGIDIKGVTDGFTYSQSVKGHTIFTIHAAKAIQRDNGKTTLHNVAITLYGAPGTNRTDSISGAEFEYDQPNGIVRAAGEVHLDLAAPTPAVNSVGDVKSAMHSAEADTSKPDTAKPPDPNKRIRVTTSGLTFLQKEGIAETDKPLQILYGDMRGSATGADYQSNTGFLKLHSAVEMNGTQNRQTVHLRAAAAEMDRTSQHATLHSAHITTDQDGASGDLMIIGLAKGGGIDSVHAEGHAKLESKGGMTAQAPKMDAQMADGKLRNVLMQGGVQFGNATGATGNATHATVHFDAAGVATSAQFDGGVRLNQQVPGVERSLTAEHLVTAMAPDAAGHAQIREATASGPAMVKTLTTVPGKAGSVPTIHVSTLRGNTLRAVTAQRGGLNYVSEITGKGNTQLVQDDGAGTVRTSSGDDLRATLSAPGSTPKSKTQADKDKSLAGQVQAAVQVGHVVVTQRSPAKGSQPAGETRATASRAEFDDSTGGLILTGTPQVTSTAMQLAADRIVLQQGSGDAEATGSVRGVYVATSTPEDKKAAEPVHLLADRATVSGGGASAKLFGATGKLARMWSSTAQIEAPVIETDRATGRLFAHAANSESGTVRMLLPVQSAPGKASPAATGALRVSGGTLVYTPADAQGLAHADITGGVRMDSPGTQLTAKSAIATIAGAAPVTSKAASPLASGNIQSITATGDVHLQQPGRSGTGERLFYTAADQRYELTGTAAAPPHVQDSQRGNVTGAMLVFHGADDSIDVSGEPGHRVRTETEVAKPSKHK